MKNNCRASTKIKVVGRYNWLINALENTEQIPVNLLEKISDQKKFSALELPAENLFKISVNTLRSNAQNALAGMIPAETNAFEYLEELRSQLSVALEQRSTKRKSVHKKLQDKSSDLQKAKEHCTQLQQHNILLTSACMEIRDYLNALANQEKLPETMLIQLKAFIERYEIKYANIINVDDIESGLHRVK